jgi:hypothetical protein
VKRAKKKLLKPRNPLATAPLLAKGGAHQLRGKKASRARQKAAMLKETEREAK